MHNEPDPLSQALELIQPRHNAHYARRPQPVNVARFGFPVATLRHWERGDRRPRGAALVLLNVIDCEPHAVMRALMRCASLHR